jgi:hypothetical protein
MAQMTDSQVALMKSSNSEQEWNRNCDQIKREHGRQYPDDWYARIVLSGVSRETSAKWGGTDQIRII